MVAGQQVSFSKSRIAGIVTCCPSRRIDGDFFNDRFTPEEIANIQKMSGVKYRYWVRPGQSSLDLSLAAAKKLLAGLDWQPGEVDALIYVTQSPENILPATSIRMAHQLGLRAGVVAFDIN